MSSAIDGNNLEKLVTKNINSLLLKIPLQFNDNNYLAVNVSTSQFSIVNEIKTRPKADIYLIDVGSSVRDLYFGKYLCENDLNFSYKTLMGSGISVKLSSPKITIQKFSPKSFNKIFGVPEIGAGASIFVTRERYDENIKLINKWLCSEEEFINFYSLKLKKRISLNDDETLQIIKSLSNKLIMDIVQSNIKIQKLLFQGIDNFTEPYTAPWVCSNNSISPNTPYPLTVTTGSGRSKGIYTLVFKPKNISLL